MDDSNAQNSGPFRFLLIAVAGWMNRSQYRVIDYLREENRVLRGNWEIVLKREFHNLRDETRAR